MEMKGIIEHSILEDDAEICSRAARYGRRENMGVCTRVHGGGGLNCLPAASGATGRRLGQISHGADVGEKEELEKRNARRLLSVAKGIEIIKDDHTLRGKKG